MNVQAWRLETEASSAMTGRKEETIQVLRERLTLSTLRTTHCEGGGECYEPRLRPAHNQGAVSKESRLSGGHVGYKQGSRDHDIAQSCSVDQY
jgi:hypothetical protein